MLSENDSLCLQDCSMFCNFKVSVFTWQPGLVFLVILRTEFFFLKHFYGYCRNNSEVVFITEFCTRIKKEGTLFAAGENREFNNTKKLCEEINQHVIQK